MNIKELSKAYDEILKDTYEPEIIWINGRDLNELLCTDEYDSRECYIITDKGIEIFNCE